MVLLIWKAAFSRVFYRQVVVILCRVALVPIQYYYCAFSLHLSIQIIDFSLRQIPASLPAVHRVAAAVACRCQAENPTV